MEKGWMQHRCGHACCRSSLISLIGGTVRVLTCTHLCTHIYSLSLQKKSWEIIQGTILVYFWLTEKCESSTKRKMTRLWNVCLWINRRAHVGTVVLSTELELSWKRIWVMYKRLLLDKAAICIISRLVLQKCLSHSVTGWLKSPGDKTTWVPNAHHPGVQVFHTSGS